MQLRSSSESAPAPASPRFAEYNIHAKMCVGKVGSVTESGQDQRRLLVRSKTNKRADSYASRANIRNRRL
jgi:hypothetical protein